MPVDIRPGWFGSRGVFEYSIAAPAIREDREWIGDENYPEEDITAKRKAQIKDCLLEGLYMVDEYTIEIRPFNAEYQNDLDILVKEIRKMIDRIEEE